MKARVTVVALPCSQAVAEPQDKAHRRCPWRQIICWAGILVGVVVLVLGVTILALALTFTVSVSGTIVGSSNLEP